MIWADEGEGKIVVKDRFNGLSIWGFGEGVVLYKDVFGSDAVGEGGRHPG